MFFNCLIFPKPKCTEFIGQKRASRPSQIHIAHNNVCRSHNWAIVCEGRSKRDTDWKECQVFIINAFMGLHFSFIFQGIVCLVWKTTTHSGRLGVEVILCRMCGKSIRHLMNHHDCNTSQIKCGKRQLTDAGGWAAGRSWLGWWTDGCGSAEEPADCSTDWWSSPSPATRCDCCLGTWERFKATHVDEKHYYNRNIGSAPFIISRNYTFWPFTRI